MKPSRVTAALVAAAAVGAGGGAGAYALATSGSPTKVTRAPNSAPARAAAATSQLSVNEIYRRTYRGVVEITVSSTSSSPYPYGGGQTEQAQGSGLVYDANGDIVTNEHVVAGANTITVRFWNGATYRATLVGSDASTDLAVLHVDAPASLLHPLQLGDPDALQVGDGVVAIGSPFGLENTVTSGIVSALHRVITSPNNFTIDDAIQTDAAINHGNSGGPLLNAQGQVVGVNAQIESGSGGNDGVGFAIPSSTVRSIVSQFISGGAARHAYLGVAIAANSSGGARLAEVRSGTPAESAGLQAGDLVTAVDGKRISSGEALRAAIGARKPGTAVTLRVVRDGTTRTVRVRLTTRPD